MSFATPYHVPGGFNFDAPTPSGQPLHADVFRPPPSPSTSSYNLAKSTGSLFSDISMSTAQTPGAAKRKRTGTRESTPLDWHMGLEGAQDGRENERPREFRYTLAGQISTTPGSAAVGVESNPLDDSIYSDVDYRRALGPKTALGDESLSTELPERGPANASNMAGWSIFSLQTIGHVVGKVWEFCKNGAVFQGFRAGGGQGYSANGSTMTETTGERWDSGPEPNAPISPPVDDTSMMNQDAPAYVPYQAPAPYSPAYYDPSSPDSTPRPAAKRRQVSNHNDELRNWVVVDEPGDEKPRLYAAGVRAPATARPSGLARPQSGYYSQTSASSHRRISTPSQRFTGGVASRPSLRVSHAGSPNLTPREPASFASPRSSPSRIPVPVQPPAPQSYNPNPFAIPTPATANIATSNRRQPASRPASRQSYAPQHTARPSLGSLSTTSAFNTTTRRPLSPSKLSNHRTHHNPHRRNNSTASSPSTTTTTAMTPTTTPFSHARRKSAAAAATTTAGVRSPNNEAAIVTSPRLDAEARQLAQRKLAAERDADAKVDAFNARLLSMIRQGREALGTRVEVEMELDGEYGTGGVGVGGGWEDDD